MAVQIQLRNGIASQWTSVNPTLAVGEIGVETDTNRFKVGTGSSSWNTLGYATGFAYKGTWSDATTYVVNDIVTYNNSSYISIQNGSNNNPSTQSAYWSVIALAGANGTSFVWRGTWVTGTSYAVNDIVYYNNSSYICTSAVQSSTPPNLLTDKWSIIASGTFQNEITVLNSLTTQFDGVSTHFQLKVNQTPINLTADNADFEVVIDGNKLTPYVTNLTYPWLTPYDSFKGFRVRKFTDSTNVTSNYVTIYNAPYIGETSSISVKTPVSDTRTTKYPFSATTIAFGD